jgi:anti-anti-sigma regulatory factor
LWSVGYTRLVLDLREVRMVDSTGLRLLLTWHAHRWADGVAFSVIPGPPAVQQVLELSGVANRLTFLSRDGASASPA